MGWQKSVFSLTHCDRVTNTCVSKPTITGSDNGLSPGRLQAIIWTNAGILLIGLLGTNFSEMLSEIQTFSLRKIRLKMSSEKCCPFRLGLNVLSVLYHTFSVMAYRTTSPAVKYMISDLLSIRFSVVVFNNSVLYTRPVSWNFYQYDGVWTSWVRVLHFICDVTKIFSYI